MDHTGHRLCNATAVITTAIVTLAAGCHQPQTWSFTGPRVYLIEGTPDEASDGLALIRHQLEKHCINARLFCPDDWLDIVVDIDARPDEEVILVGHGHGAFLATQVVRHYAQHHKTKFIEAVFTLDAYNKDWPHSLRQCGRWTPHARPMPTPIGHNALKVRNYTQTHPESRRWGGDLVSTRASDVARRHPYEWYGSFWTRRPVTGQHLGEKIEAPGVLHETIDNHDALLQRILMKCRKAALSPYHYTPPMYHPDARKKDKPQQATPGTLEAT